MKKLLLDENKENILIIPSDSFDLNIYNYINGHFKVIADVLQEKYNIIWLSLSSTKNLNIQNVIHFPISEFEKKYKVQFLRKEHAIKNGCLDTYKNINHAKMREICKNFLKDLPKIKHCLFDGICMPLQNYKFVKEKNLYNEFFDTVKNEDIDKINAYNDIAIKIYEQLIPTTAFSQQSTAAKVSIIKVLSELFPDMKMATFVIDPFIYAKLLNSFFDKHVTYYFETDKRGTRDFEGFPIGQLQHFVYDNSFNKYNTNDLFDDYKIEEKSMNFIWAGTILHDKGPRPDMYYKYLHNLDIENSSLYISPVKNGILWKEKSEENITNTQEKYIEKLKNIISDMYSHKMYKGYLFPVDIRIENKKHKYSLIMRCVSIHDSLNARIYAFLNDDILPFIDPEYDPCYLQIPKKYQDILRVDNSKDIIDKVKYFNEHDEERINLLTELKRYYKFDSWKDKKFVKNEVMKYF